MPHQEPTQMVINVLSVYGMYTITPEKLDEAIAKYLPSSVRLLRDVLTEATNGEVDYSKVTTVTECLILLSGLDGNTT